DTFGNDVPQKSGAADRVMFENVVGRSFIALLVKDGTGEVDLQKEDLPSPVHAKVEPGVTLAFKAGENGAGGGAQTAVEFRNSDGDVALGMVLLDLELVRLETRPVWKQELDRPEGERLERVGGVGRHKNRELPAINVLLDHGLAEATDDLGCFRA